MAELDIENELFDQVVHGIKTDVQTSSGSIQDTADLETAATTEIGKKLKKAMKAIAVEQLRISWKYAELMMHYYLLYEHEHLD